MPSVHNAAPVLLGAGLDKIPCGKEGPDCRVCLYQRDELGNLLGLRIEPLCRYPRARQCLMIAVACYMNIARDLFAGSAHLGIAQTGVQASGAEGPASALAAHRSGHR